jgi:hypothetical protein
MTDPRAALADVLEGEFDPVAVQHDLAERGVLLVPTGFVEAVAATSNDPHLVAEAERILSGEVTETRGTADWKHYEPALSGEAPDAE